VSDTQKPRHPISENKAESAEAGPVASRREARVTEGRDGRDTWGADTPRLQSQEEGERTASSMSAWL